MTINEKLEIAKLLQKHHYFFRTFWDIGNPVLVKSDTIKTACITFDKKGNCVNLTINVDFWNTLNEQSKLFLICHEMLHIILNHGYRFLEYIGTKHFEKLNYAADVVINETLCEKFGFNRHELNDSIKYEMCWYDTVFVHQPNVKHNQSTDYYFNLLKHPEMEIPQNIKLMDNHEVVTEESQEVRNIMKENGLEEAMENIIKEEFPAEKKTDIVGNQFGNWSTFDNIKTKTKKKWETVIKEWESKYLKEIINETQRWERTAPRYSQIIKPGIHLPSNLNVIDEILEKDKLDVYFFLDTSGSCIHLQDRFLSAALSLNPKKFNVSLFSFDTSVKEVDIKNKKIYGGGGTSFSIIENFIQKKIKKENKKYPQAVWVITDGMGNSINPQYPKKWYWFLSRNFTKCIPKECHIFNLDNYS